jgi:uncharacterized protein YdiU (UPF0061 family)
MEAFQTLSKAKKTDKDKSIWADFLSKYVDALSLTQPEANLSLYDRHRQMAANNPTFILRNWIMQDAIESATASSTSPGDYSKVRFILEMLRDPFNTKFSIFLNQDSIMATNLDPIVVNYCKPSPEWASELVCTCSS